MREKEVKKIRTEDKIEAIFEKKRTAFIGKAY